MSLARAELPTDPAALRAFVLACQDALRAAELAVQYKTLEIEKLKFQIAKLRRMQFGRSSERINRQIAQLELRLEELESGAAEDVAKVEAANPAAPMAGFTGFLQADGYSGFEALYHPARTKPGPIIEVACWAHCRCKIFDVWEQTKSPVAKEALDRIAAFYLIEDKARFAPAAERVEHRKATASLLEAFFTWAEATVPKLSAKSALAEAFRYILKRREALMRFVTDGRLEADNNIAENAMRKIALGRKNYLFAGSDRGGERAAAIYTLVVTARLNGLNPEAYLKDILTRIANGHLINRIDELLPWRMTSAMA